MYGLLGKPRQVCLTSERQESVGCLLARLHASIERQQTSLFVKRVGKKIIASAENRLPFLPLIKPCRFAVEYSLN